MSDYDSDYTDSFGQNTKLSGQQQAWAWYYRNNGSTGEPYPGAFNEAARNAQIAEMQASFNGRIAPDKPISGNSDLGNWLQGHVPLVGGLLGRIADIGVGALNFVVGVASFGQLGSGIERGFNQVLGGVGGLTEIAATDLFAGMVGVVGYAYTKVADTANVLLLGSVFKENFKAAIGRLVQDVLIPDYGMFGGPHWGLDQKRGESMVLNWVDENSLVHDRAFGRQYPNASATWVQNNWTPVPRNYIPPGPLGILYTLLGTIPFTGSNAILGY